MSQKRSGSFLALALASIIVLSPTMLPNALSQSNVQQSEYFSMSVSQNSLTFPYGPTLDNITLSITPHNGFSGKIDLSTKYAGKGIYITFSNQADYRWTKIYSVSPLNPYSHVPLYPQVRVIIQTDSYQWKCNGFDCMPGPSTDPGNYTIYIYGNSTSDSGIITKVVPINLTVSKPVPYHPSNPSCGPGMMWDQEDGICITISTSHLSPSAYSIPSWVENNARWWSQGTIGDSDFFNGIQYLISHDMLKIPPTVGNMHASTYIPALVKKTLGWWADGQVSNDAFLRVIQSMISQGIITK